MVTSSSSPEPGISPDLETLLSYNYAGLTPENGELCKRGVINYLGSVTSVSGRDIYFIKRLIKVSNHILESDPRSLDEYLKKLFDFANEGINKIRTGADSSAENCTLTLESHFLAYAGNFAQALFNVTGDILWAMEWYKLKKLSADMTVKTEPKYSAHAYSFAGDAASALSKLTKESVFAELAITSYIHLLSHYNLNPDGKMDTLITQTKKIVNFLQQFLPKNSPLLKEIPQYL
ncbi:hypothetical protein KY347_06625 [Candidatus Woesearchaeota archaeon]|nr:hypothetical protein [Candidatus Woesearchaeota archaeon]